MTKYICIILLLIILGCKNKGRKEELLEFYSKTIQLPDLNYYNLNGIDTINVDIMKSKLKLIIYFDSINCTSCYISKLIYWKPFIEYSCSLRDELSLVFVLFPPNSEKETIKFKLMSYPIDYPVLIDKNGDFEKLNPHLPKNKAMHTFLLDENNKVILVGNPLYNKEIEKLFYKITQEQLTK